MDFIGIIGIVFGWIATITTIIGLLPQIYKAYKTKSTDDVSSLMLWDCFLCSLSWTVHGLISGDAFVIWSNVIGLLTSSTTIIQKRLYDRKK
jgi:MtN3 and saliva related transmembrane protein